MQEIIFDNKLSKIKYKKFTLIKKNSALKRDSRG